MIMSEIRRIENNPRMSDAVIHNGTVYLRGFVPSSSFGQSIQEQTQDIISQLDNTLQASNSSKSSLLSVTIWLTDIGDMAEFNEVYDTWLKGITPPARACTEAKLFRADCGVEISAIAAVEG